MKLNWKYDENIRNFTKKIKIERYNEKEKALKQYSYKKWHPFDQVCFCIVLLRKAEEIDFYYENGLHNDICPFYVPDNDTILSLTPEGHRFLRYALLRQLHCEMGNKDGLYLPYKEYFDIVNKDSQQRIGKSRVELFNLILNLDNVENCCDEKSNGSKTPKLMPLSTEHLVSKRIKQIEKEYQYQQLLEHLSKKQENEPEK